MPIRLDLHVHTMSRGRVYMEPDGIKNALKRNGLSGLAVTNFFDISHAQWLKKKLDGAMVIVGQEVWTDEGHIIGLGIKEKLDDFKSAAETIGHIHEQGALAVAPHPHIFLGVGRRIASLDIDAVESYNAYVGDVPFYNHKAARTARNLKLAQVAGTDTTNAVLVGRSYTEIRDTPPDEWAEGIKKGRVGLHKKALPLPVAFFLRGLFQCRNMETCDVHATPCMICGRSMAVRLFRREYVCMDCGKKAASRIVCSNGHYLCMPCMMKRESSGPERQFPE